MIALVPIGISSVIVCVGITWVQTDGFIECGNRSIVVLFIQARLAIFVGLLRRIGTCRNARQQQDYDQHDRQSLACVHGFSSEFDDLTRTASSTLVAEVAG